VIQDAIVLVAEKKKEEKKMGGGVHGSDFGQHGRAGPCKEEGT
jgi:hypothetical protein